MPIIKKYVDMMGGSLKVKSKLGEGSKFTVIMEYRIADKGYYEQVTDLSPDTEETDWISGKHVLLAEDNDLNAEIAQFILEDMGLMVDRVEDGVQCVSRIEQKPAGRVKGHKNSQFTFQLVVEFSMLNGKYRECPKEFRSVVH